MPSAITPFLMQGSWPRDMTLAFQHADTVVFCAQEMPPPKHTVPAGKATIYIPYDDTHDLSAVPIIDLQRLAKRLAGEIQRGRRVLITCAMGLNRSGLLSALTVARAYNVSGAEAVKLVKQKRNGALCNHVFAKLAQELADGKRAQR